MLMLPPARHSFLRSFGTVVFGLGGLLLNLILLTIWLTLGIWNIVVGVVSLTLLLVVLFQPWILYVPYREWNKLVVRVAGLCRTYVLGTNFFLFFTLVGSGPQSKAAMQLHSPRNARSNWTPKTAIPIETYSSQGPMALRRNGNDGPLQELLTWAVNSRNWWVCCLLPCLMLLSFLDTDQDTDLPVGIYTLF